MKNLFIGATLALVGMLIGHGIEHLHQRAEGPAVERVRWVGATEHPLSEEHLFPNTFVTCYDHNEGHRYIRDCTLSDDRHVERWSCIDGVCVDTPVPKAAPAK